MRKVIEMSAKRRDKKGRVLRSGEYQQKDGRYRFTYYVNGKQKCFYSWKLEPTDRLPAGKRVCVSLREQEAEWKKARDYGIEFRGGEMSVIQLLEKYVALKKGVRVSTKKGYQSAMNHVRNSSIANVRIDKLKKSDAQLLMTQFQEQGKSYSLIDSIHGLLKMAFQMAVDDDLILKNPFLFSLKGIIEDDSTKREALTEEQKMRFLEFIRNDSDFCKYYEPIVLLFESGVRISEFCGLTVQNIDMENRQIRIQCQLLKDKNRYWIEEPKTPAGNRILPMSDKVYKCFQTIFKKRNPPAYESMVDGKAGFLFLDRNGNPRYGNQWVKIFEQICEKYNEQNLVQLPKITPHGRVIIRTS